MTMKYRHNGWLPGLPARDLTDEEVEKFGGVNYLTATGLYEEITNEPKQEPPALPVEQPKRKKKQHKKEGE